MATVCMIGHYATSLVQGFLNNVQCSGVLCFAEHSRDLQCFVGSRLHVWHYRRYGGLTSAASWQGMTAAVYTGKLGKIIRF